MRMSKHRAQVKTGSDSKTLEVMKLGGVRLSDLVTAARPTTLHETEFRPKVRFSSFPR